MPVAFVAVAAGALTYLLLLNGRSSPVTQLWSPTPAPGSPRLVRNP